MFTDPKAGYFDVDSGIAVSALLLLCFGLRVVVLTHFLKVTHLSALVADMFGVGMPCAAFGFIFKFSPNLSLLFGYQIDLVQRLLICRVGLCRIRIGIAGSLVEVFTTAYMRRFEHIDLGGDGSLARFDFCQLVLRLCEGVSVTDPCRIYRCRLHPADLNVQFCHLLFECSDLIPDALFTEPHIGKIEIAHMLCFGGNLLVLLGEFNEQIRDGIAALLCLCQNFGDVYKMSSSKSGFAAELVLFRYFRSVHATIRRSF